MIFKKETLPRRILRIAPKVETQIERLKVGANIPPKYCETLDTSGNNQ